VSAWVWLAVAGAGGLAALARFSVDAAVVRRLGADFPFATLTVNLSAAFVLGLLVGLALSGVALLIAGTATIGSYSTFSTWMLESERLGARGRVTAAAVNLVAGVVLGVAAAALGRAIGMAL
jgi:CrcB protein